MKSLKRQMYNLSQNVFCVCSEAWGKERGRGERGEEERGERERRARGGGEGTTEGGGQNAV